jgi:hypothetical protein
MTTFCIGIVDQSKRLSQTTASALPGNVSRWLLAISMYIVEAVFGCLVTSVRIERRDHVISAVTSCRATLGPASSPVAPAAFFQSAQASSIVLGLLKLPLPI